MAKTNDEFILEISQISPEIEITGKYTKATERISVRCRQCGHVWNPLAYSLSQGKSCPHCSAKRGAKKNQGKTGLKSHDQFIAEMSNTHPTIVVLGEYINGHTNIECQCSICSHRWMAKPYSLLQQHGCPRCIKSGTSFMEQFIRTCFAKVLGDEAVISRDKATIGMELDIFIPSLSIAIEPGNWYLHKQSVERDRIKRERCSSKGIRLITIYDKFPPNESCPFSSDCYIFAEDLNKADHVLIKKLVISLFDDLSIQHSFSASDWEVIELEAYEKAKAKTHKDFLAEMKSIHPNIEVLEEYKNANIRMRVRCSVCKHEWEALPASLLSGDGCKKCGVKLAHEKFIKSQSEFEQQVFAVNPDIQILGNYTGRHNSIHVKCLICGYEWQPRASSLLRGSNHKGWKTIHKKLCR